MFAGSHREDEIRMDADLPLTSKFYVGHWIWEGAKFTQLLTEIKRSASCICKFSNACLFLHPFPVAISPCLLKEESDLHWSMRRNKYQHHAKKVSGMTLYQVTALNATRIWIKLVGRLAMGCRANFSLSKLRLMQSPGTSYAKYVTYQKSFPVTQSCSINPFPLANTL